MKQFALKLDFYRSISLPGSGSSHAIWIRIRPDPDPQHCEHKIKTCENVLPQKWASQARRRRRLTVLPLLPGVLVKAWTLRHLLFTNVYISLMTHNLNNVPTFYIYCSPWTFTGKIWNNFYKIPTTYLVWRPFFLIGREVILLIGALKNLQCLKTTKWPTFKLGLIRNRPSLKHEFGSDNPGPWKIAQDLQHCQHVNQIQS